MTVHRFKPPMVSFRFLDPQLASIARRLGRGCLLCPWCPRAHLFGKNYRITETTGLWLYTSGLNGALHTEIGYLTAMESLDREWLANRSKGLLPSELGLLASLTDLDFGFTALTGTLLTELGGLTALTRLSFYG